MGLPQLPHALVLPYPAQGHVIPLMELSHCLVDHGFRITFVNTEFNHERVVAALSKESRTDEFNLLSVPDGLGSDEDRNDLGRLTEAFMKTMPLCLEELILKSREEGEEITCMIADDSMAWALEVAKKTGLRSAAFWPASALLLATILGIPDLISRGVIDEDGAPIKQEMFALGPGMPLMNTAHFVWNCLGDRKTQQIVFNYMLNNNRATDIAEFIICNSFREIEEPVFTNTPKILPVGPLLSGLRPSRPVGHFWSEDTTCESWLDEHPPGSVIYVAFGSFTIFDRRQFEELALGLEATGRPFLWVVRPDLTGQAGDPYPCGFRERVGGRGRMVAWSPQHKVLAHPSVGCFVSHCGWNSTMEGVRNGVLFLCWPYFGDQFLNQSYICDVWKVGLRLIADGSGIVKQQHIKSKVEELLGNGGMRARVSVLKEKAHGNISKGGSSLENLNAFVHAMKREKA
ncbi:UDP-glycosyltransferase 83A1-like [Canna indica]|uniref:UDP-glycosyltransferase 83A1-like n=1 Tax=Canna indica TaxID=4628 RepID=A0AAQ3KZT7_9LILI|nr:UDP-glycosyltransferase 83A1-like [Canna indica]